MRSALLSLLVVGCASTPTFTDLPNGNIVTEVVILHRIADEHAVRAECMHRQRTEGIAVREGAPGCSWKSDGRWTILCPNPGSFNNERALLVCGHEAYHAHNAEHR